MRTLLLLTKRNIKLFFKDKGMFFTALISSFPLLLKELISVFIPIHNAIEIDAITSDIAEIIDTIPFLIFTSLSIQIPFLP